MSDDQSMKLVTSAIREVHYQLPTMHASDYANEGASENWEPKLGRVDAILAWHNRKNRLMLRYLDSKSRQWMGLHMELKSWMVV